MNKNLFMIAALAACMHANAAGAAETTVFGPKTFDVVNRRGAENIYQETFASPRGRHLLKIQNGDKSALGSTFIALTLNGDNILKDGRYGYPCMIIPVPLKKENTLALVLKDAVPLASKAPRPPARRTTISVVSQIKDWPDGIFGAYTWENLNAVYSALRKIQNPLAVAAAVKVLDLKQDVSSRADAARKLADLRDPAAADMLALLFRDIVLPPDIKGEVAVGLGMLRDKQTIDDLAAGLLDEEEKVRVSSARALSLYPEADVRAPIIKVLGSLDPMQASRVIPNIAEGGLKTIDTFNELAASSDPVRNGIGLLLLGGTGSPKAVGHLLELLKEPNKYDKNLVIRALGLTRSPAALEPLSAIARDESARKGYELVLAEALAELGDKSAAPLIGDMIETETSRSNRRKLRTLYRRLTGTRYHK